jgi:hypothetical protein
MMVSEGGKVIPPAILSVWQLLPCEKSDNTALEKVLNGLHRLQCNAVRVLKKHAPMLYNISKIGTEQHG